MKIKNLISIVLLILSCIFVFNRFFNNKIDTNNKNYQNLNNNYDFNNNHMGCNDSLPPNNQLLWNCLDKENIKNNDLKNGEIFFLLSEVYFALAQLIGSANLDLYYEPVFKNAHPALPIGKVLPKNKDAEKLIQFNKKIVGLSQDSLFKLFNSKQVVINNNINEELLIFENSGHYFGDTELILKIASGMLSQSKTIIYNYLQNVKNLSPEHYKLWLFLVKSNLLEDKDWNKIPIHDFYVNSISDSIKSETSPIGLIFDNLSFLLEKKWITLDIVSASLIESDYEIALPILDFFSNDIKKIQILIKKNLNLEIYQDINLASRYVDLLCKYYYENNNYEQAMIEITRFWFDDMSNHPREWMCFDNYPKFLIDSYKYGRWDGGRLPLFLYEYAQIKGTDPLLLMGFDFFQRYNSIISIPNDN